MNLNTIGKDVSEARSAQECMEIAGLNYKMHTERMYVRGKNLVDGIPVIGGEVPNQFAIVREDTNTPIAVVGKQYTIAQNASCFGFFDGLVEQGHAKFERAYSTHGGARVHIVADLGDMDIGGDKSKKRLTLRNSHDGTSKITGILEVYRLVCSNGLMAFSRHASFAIKHTRSYYDKFAEAKKIIGIADQYYKWFANQADKLVDMPLTPQKAQELIKVLVPATDEKNVTKRVENQREKIFDYFDHGQGNSGKSRWDLYNGVAEYIDHWRSRNRQGDVAVETNLVGSGAKLKKQAFEHLLYAE